MPRSRISSPQGAAHSVRTRGQNKLKVHRFVGVSLSGGKNDRTSVTVLEYYPSQKKLFLNQVYEHIQQVDEISADQALLDIINENSKDLEYLCLDAPLKLPKCIRCRLVCPGYEKCKEPEISWMWKQIKKTKKKKRRGKLFTPYTQRASEIYITNEVEEVMTPLEALGANIAPLAARAFYILRRLPKAKAIEIYPRLSVMRIGQALKISKSHLNHYKHQIGGDESRQVILQTLIKRDIVFIYQQDYLRLIDNANTFDAFISAFTGFLKFLNQCEKPPKDFPLTDGWIEIPVVNLDL